MNYVKGCDIFGLSKYSLNKIINGKVEVVDGLKNELSYEVLSNMLAEAKVDFVDCSGKTIKGMPSAEIFVMTKKIDKKKYIIGLSYIKRIAGEPSEKTGIARWFEESRDKAIEEKRYFADGFGKEEEYFDYSMIDHFKNSVGCGQLKEAEYRDKVVTRLKGKKVLGVFISSTMLFILMAIIWGLIFKNIGIGICFALCFVGSFAMVTTRSKTEEKDISKSEV
ncbi:MAG: hypothetical protein IKS75_06940 [Clostridiales bacterium]|nr:hypothetical protein [Clostridiales bacterium]